MNTHHARWREGAVAREKQFLAERARTGEHIFMYDDAENVNLLVWAEKILSDGADKGLQIMIEDFQQSNFVGDKSILPGTNRGTLSDPAAQRKVSNTLIGHIIKKMRPFGLSEDECEHWLGDHKVRRFIINAETPAKRDEAFQTLAQLLTEKRMEEITGRTQARSRV